MKRLKRILSDLRSYPSAVVGLVIILLLVGLSIYTAVTIPYSKAIALWRGGVGVWDETPRLAYPAWYNWISGKNLPPTLIYDSAKEGQVERTERVDSAGNKQITLIYTIDYPYEGFLQEMSVFFTASYKEAKPNAGMTWITPDGREVNLGNTSVGATEIVYISQNEKLQRRLGGRAPNEGLFADPDSEALVLLNGTYQLRIDIFTFEPDTTVDAKLVLFGQVHGIAGTDHLRRDISIALMWGTPIALSFGLLAALGISLTTMLIAAVATWYGGWVDSLIQRITNVNMVLPFLSILIMVGTFYDRSIWVMLGMTILLSIFGGAILNYRSIFMQIKESPFVEAAKAYGANDWRVITRYLVPRIIPLLIPALVSGIPSYVFLEASLAVLGLGDPTLPTWGKVINEAYFNGALYQGLYYWVLEPAILLMLTGLAFALLGFALDRMFNPRLRGM